jgi:hypothetical protein
MGIAVAVAVICTSPGQLVVSVGKVWEENGNGR